MFAIFHAFNIPYSTIASLAPNLRDMGFTHIQLPPIQTARILTEMDAELLLSLIRTKDIHINQYQSLVAKAQAKNAQYPPHTFDFLLQQTIKYIQQPTLRQLYSGNMIDTPEYRFFASVAQAGQEHPFYPLIKAAKLVLEWKPLPQFSPNKLQQLMQEQEKVQAQIKEQRTKELLNVLSNLKKQILQEKTKRNIWERQLGVREQLSSLVPVTTQLREQLRIQGIPAASQPIPKKELEDIVYICEYLLYPPWWILYQPLELRIGTTPLGNVEEILHAIRVCKNNGLSVIADVIVNNLAASAGEKGSWEPVIKKTKDQNATLLSHVQSDSPVIGRVQDLLEYAFGSKDLSLLTAPYECREGQDPIRCWMSGCLPQLNPSHPLIREKQTEFLKSLLGAGVDGIRVDAAAHLTPEHCSWLLSFFSGLSYIEYVGPDAHKYSVRKEDFAIGEDAYRTIFSEQGYLQKTTNYGEHRLHRLELDSVTMIVNHDQIMGTIPSSLFERLPSKVTYELSLVYLIQRAYGHILLLPHDTDIPIIREALQFRKKMREFSVVNEYVSINNNIIRIDKLDIQNNTVLVAYINMNPNVVHVEYGPLGPFSFQWYYLASENNRQIAIPQIRMMNRCYTRTNRIKNRRNTRKFRK